MCIRRDRIIGKACRNGRVVTGFPIQNFWRLFAQRYRGRNVIFAYDLLNEPEIRWNPPKDADVLACQRSREDIADEWTRRQVAAIKAVDPAALVTIGLIQWSVPALLPGVKHYSGFRPARQAKFLDFMEIHFYPLDHKPGDFEARNWAYLESVVREVAAPGKPVVVAEFGWNRAGDEEQQARWCGRAVERTAGPACGWLNWGLYDVAQARDGSQFCGLLTTNGTAKAWAHEFQRLAGTLKIPPVQRRELPVLDWDRCIVDTKAGDAFREALTPTLEHVQLRDRHADIRPGVSVHERVKTNRDGAGNLGDGVKHDQVSGAEYRR